MFIPTKADLEAALGQRVMDYKVENGEVSFSIRPEVYGYDTDKGWYADFVFDTAKGDLVWIPDIPTECLSPNTKIDNIDALAAAIEDYGSWEMWEGEEDDDE